MNDHSFGHQDPTRNRDGDMVRLCYTCGMWCNKIDALCFCPGPATHPEDRQALLDRVRYLTHCVKQLERPTIEDYYTEQCIWSLRTFGEGKRTAGVVEHIQKELQEILAKPDDLEEWIDVIMLAMDGFFRAGGKPTEIIAHLRAKQAKNFARKWNVPEDGRAVEHIREVQSER